MPLLMNFAGGEAVNMHNFVALAPACHGLGRQLDLGDDVVEQLDDSIRAVPVTVQFRTPTDFSPRIVLQPYPSL